MRRDRGRARRAGFHAWKAQHRLYTLFHRIAAHRPSQVAAVAVARELVGFLWAVMREPTAAPSILATAPVSST